jgi:anti-sigma B factor antagonist
VRRTYVVEHEGRFGHQAEQSRDVPVRGVERNGSAVVVHLVGELDLYNAGAVRNSLLGSAEEQPERLVVDLAEVEFVDSTTLGVLVEAKKALRDGRSLFLAAPGVATRRALEVTGLDRHFALCDSVADALAAPI